jgi:FkbM family methyltransferase
MSSGRSLRTVTRLAASRSRRALLRPVVRARPTADLVRLGSQSCGWWVPAGVVEPGAVAYCAGAGEDISFDLELHRRGMNVVTIDPTPRAIAYVDRVKPDDDRFTFLPVGLWHEPGELAFYAPDDPDAVSHSALNLQRTSEHFVARVDQLAAIMREVGHDHIDLLKVDIEGAESTVLPHMLVHGPHPDVVCFEYDQPQSARGLLGLLRTFRQSGYDLLRQERWNFTLGRVTSGGPAT